jgi:hypothetical protein
MDTLLITLISLLSNLICQIHYLKINNLYIFLVTDHKMCFNFFLLVDILTSLSFARR